MGKFAVLISKGPSTNDVNNFWHPLPNISSFLILFFGNFDQFLTPSLLTMSNVVYGRPQISTLKLLWKNARNAKQRPKRLHFKVGYLKSDNQGLYPGCNGKIIYTFLGGFCFNVWTKRYGLISTSVPHPIDIIYRAGAVNTDSIKILHGSNYVQRFHRFFF